MTKIQYAESRFYKDQADRIINDSRIVAVLDGATAGTSAGPFLAQELESIDRRVHRVLERELRFARLMNVNSTEVTPGSQSYAWTQEDRSGRFLPVAASGKNLPTVDVSTEKFKNYLNTLHGAAMEITTQELRAAIMANRPLSERKADAIRRAYNEARQALAMTGDEQRNKTGLINDSNITPVVASTKTAGGTTWAVATGQEIYDDCAAAVVGVRNATKNTVIPDTIALSNENYTQAMSTKFNPEGNVDKSVMQVVEEAFGVTFVPISEMEDSVTVSGSDYNQLLCYENDPMNIEFMQGLDLSQRPGQWEGLTYSVPYEAELVGCVIRKPVCFYSIYGI